jgi:2-polyprenyl-3-methyl-5-hydroxy-6-metoxy-1,4-benzoquinol methylase
MDDSRALDLDRTMEQLRFKVHENRRRTESNSAAGCARPEDDPLLRQDLAELDRACDLTGVSLDPHRKVLGLTILTAAKVVSALLGPIIRRQSEYNAANTRLTSHLKAHTDRIDSKLTELRLQTETALAQNAGDFKRQTGVLLNRLARTHAADLAMQAQALDELSHRVAALEQRQAAAEEQANRLELVERRHDELRQELDRLADQDRRLASLDERYAELATEVTAARTGCAAHHEEFKLTRERVLRAERRLRRFLAAGSSNGAAPAHESALAPDGVEAEIDYAGFEDRLRDSALVREKQRDYVSYFAGRAPVLDVGCGKGEFLELMGEAAIDAKGLDLDLDMVLLCREKGLDVERCDAVDYLARQSDESVGGIFSAQVIEHLTSAQLSALITLAWRKLKPGGILVLETLNPESLFVHYKWFWMDPSHIRLVHPQTLRFMLESAGFAEIAARFAAPPHGATLIPPLRNGSGGGLDEFNRATDYLNKLLYSEQEYALIASK